MSDATIQTFLTTGALGSIRLGLHRDTVRHVIGNPDTYTLYRRTDDRMRAAIWKYGDIELHFAQDILWLIDVEYAHALRGSTTFPVEPWILCGPVSHTMLQAAVQRAGILLTAVAHPNDPQTTQWFQTEAGIVLMFVKPPVPGPTDFQLAALSLHTA